MSNHNRGVLNEPDPSTYGAIFVFIFILHTAIPSPVVAQTSEAFTSAGYGNIDTSMIVIVVILICSFFIIGFFSIYIRQCSDQALTSAADGRDLKSARGLDPSVIESFPVFQYSGVKDLKIGKNALECAVCINEFDDDDELRLLPKCDHVFHPECIDAWLLSHSTCPVCRSNLSPDSLACDKTQIDEPIESIHESNNSPSPNQNQDQISINIEDRIRQARYYDIWSRKIYRTGKFTRSHSTGHSVCQLSENSERHRLVLPEEVRKRILTLKRTTSCVFVYPKEEGSRRGYRSSGEGSSRGKSYPDRLFWRSDRWVFTMTPPFVSRTGLSRSPKAGAGGSIRTSLDCLSGRADGAEKSSVRPPV